MLVETRKDAIVIPTVAIQHGPQDTYVYVVGQDKTAQMKPVTIALTTGEIALIAKGLVGGERVIIEGQNQVRPGGRVEPGSAAGGPGDRAGAGGAPDRRRGSADPEAAPGARRSPAGSADTPPGAGGPAAGGPWPGGPAAQGQTRARGPATGPTASTQAPAP
jgi:multidrug efflux system membrane fusion protein